VTAGSSLAFHQHLGQLCISAITVAELFVWVGISASPFARRASLLKLLDDMTVLNVDMSVSERFGEVRTKQLGVGQLTPEMDLLISSTALVHGLILVTHNMQDFGNVPGLQVVDWLAP
jgi:tRNA(fMet)-specific endonuclease VapC